MPKTNLRIVACAYVLSVLAVLPIKAQKPANADKKADRKTYLLIVAHPDDENMIGAYLSRLVREGNTVEVIIATDGKYGSRVTDIPEGDALGAVRRRESECASRKLGLPEPIFLAIDRLDTRNGVRPYLNGRKELLRLLRKHLDRIKPDVILTFGPDGEYGHPEHIVVGAAITEVLLRDTLVDKYPLYYMAWTRDQVLDDEELSYVDEAYVDVMATYSDEDEQKSFEAGKCFASQFTPEEIEKSIKQASEDKSNRVNFRRFSATAAKDPNRKPATGF